MQIWKAVAVFHNYQNFSDVIAEGTKQASERKRDYRKCAYFSALLFRRLRHEQVVRSDQVVRSPAFSIQADNSNSGNDNTSMDLYNDLKSLSLICDPADGLACNFNSRIMVCHVHGAQMRKQPMR